MWMRGRLLTAAEGEANIFGYTNMIEPRTRPTALTTTNTAFRAFADENRIRLLNLLLEGEVCVCDLCAALDMPQPRISRHLTYLRRAGLVTVRQDGKWKYYAAAKPRAGLQRRLLNCVRGCLRDIDMLQEDLVRLEEVRQRSRCC
jgi:ArsR family transcriptional regulator